LRPAAAAITLTRMNTSGTQDEVDARPAAGAAFVTTHWSVVTAAGHANTTRSRDALARLCQAYWHPLYAYVRRLGHSPPDAEDLTQEFFTRLLAKNYLAAADESRGRFRSFLLSALKHFLANEWDKAQAQKRGGGMIPIQMDFTAAETACHFEPADNLTADKIFERRWALTLLDQVLRRLREEYTSSGREKLFEQLKPTLTEASHAVRYAEIALRLGTSEGAVKVAVHRLRQRYRQVLRAEIAETVASPGEVEDELKSLFAALAG
jgi:RNA polymerase sigma-70 factor (ECF subfamily)